MPYPDTLECRQGMLEPPSWQCVEWARPQVDLGPARSNLICVVGEPWELNGLAGIKLQERGSLMLISNRKKRHHAWAPWLPNDAL